MLFQRQKYISDFHEVSVVMILCDELDSFKNIFNENNLFFIGNGIEVIIVVTNENANQVVFKFINNYTHINWKIILCTEGDTDTNMLLHIVLRNATYDYFIFLDAFSKLITNVIYQLRYILYHFSNSFALGRKENRVCSDLYGSFMAEKKQLLQIESIWKLEGKNLQLNDIISYLELLGQKKMFVPEAVTYHTEESCNYFRNDTILSNKISFSHLQKTDYPISQFSKNYEDYNFKISFDWQKNKLETAKQETLAKFQKVSIQDADIFTKKYKVVCLMQVRNEKKNMPGVLIHLEQYCDGMLLLDDGSEDGTYEDALSAKLLLKAQKRYTGHFDDLGNRNLLLELANLIQSEWFFFMDADERFDLRYTDLYKLADMKGVDVITFRLIHLWNMTNYYRKDIPEGKNGILRRYRMFRNKGFMQIEASRDLHFKATPFKKVKYKAEALILHEGLMDESIRKRKYAFYIQHDADGKKQGYSYDYLLDHKPLLAYVKDL